MYRFARLLSASCPCGAALLVLGSLWLVACGDDAAGEGSVDAGGPDAPVGDSTAGGERDADAPSSDAFGTFRTAFDATPHGAFMSIWASAPDDVYTVGGQPSVPGVDAAGVVFHFDGVSWRELEVPAGGMLNWVYGVDGEAWVVGEQGRALRFADGAFVEETSTGVDAPLWGVWGAAADDLWAVGGDARDRNGAPVLVRWDGAEWTNVELPELDRPAPALFKVWGTSATQIFAVGSRGVLLAYDGETWSQVPSGTGEDLVSLWGRSPDDIVCVGGRSNGVLGRFDGSAWRFETLERVSGLNGSWMAEDGTAYAAGVNGRILHFAPGSNEFTDIESETDNVLHAIFGLNGGPGYAVGGTLLNTPPYEGDVLVSE